MHAIHITVTANRAEQYQNLLPQISAVVAPENDLIANMANITAILKEALQFFWIGFYRVTPHKADELVLSPFQGPLACTRIPFSKGVCGAAASQQKTLIVPDVEKFPGHIACSSLSRSEIVVPLIVGGKTVLVLDIDSTAYNDFSVTDQQYLEQIVALLCKHYN